MILYRDMRYREYKKILDDERIPFISSYFREKENTFHYNGNEPYMHFFRNIEHARRYLCIFGEFIAKCDVPDELIEETGYGFYKYKDFKVDAPIPEVIIKRENFSSEYIEKINPSFWGNARYVLGIKEAKLYDLLLRELYRNWKRKNMYNRNEFDFCYYALTFLNSGNLDDILAKYSFDYQEKKGKIRTKKMSDSL